MVNNDINDSKIHCCSKYYECSGAGFCIQQNNFIKNSCYYRSRLENGFIYYGKTAQGFDVSKYFDLQNKIFSLDLESFNALSDIANYLFRDRHLFSSEFFYFEPAYIDLQQLGLFTVSQDLRKILDCFTIGYLRAFFGGKGKTKDDLISSITYFLEHPSFQNENDSKTWQLQFERVFNLCNISINLQMRRYFEEAFRDNLFDTALPSIDIPKDVDPFFCNKPLDKEILSFDASAFEFDDDEDRKRFERAKQISASFVHLLSSRCAAVIENSDGDLYNVTMNSCDCADFKVRQKPCKHIYRLQLELQKKAKAAEL